MVDGGSRILHPRPAANGEFGNRAQCVGEGSSVPHERKCEGTVFAKDIVRALLVVGRQAAENEVVAGQTLVAGNSSAFDNREREARKPTHVELVVS